MKVVGYELPEAEKLLGPAIARGLVQENQYGTDRVEPYSKFNTLDENGQVTPIEAHDYIVFTREGGYVTDYASKDSIIGLRVDCWAKTRTRAQKLMNEVIKRALELELQSIDGFSIDYVESLNGPEEEKNVLLHDERCFTKSFEFHIGAKFIWE